MFVLWLPENEGEKKEEDEEENITFSVIMPAEERRGGEERDQKGLFLKKVVLSFRLPLEHKK